jgi:hypothetical protein
MATTYDTKIPFRAGTRKLVIGVNASNVSAVVVSGFAASDAEIVAEIGADALYADGSLYLSVTEADHTDVDVYQKQSNVWVNLNP